MAWGDAQGLAEACISTEECSQGLDVDQVAPRFRVQGSAYLVVRVGHEAEVVRAIEGLGEALRGAVQAVDAGTLNECDLYARLPDGGWLVRVGQAGDRSPVVYGALLRAVAALAPWLEDGRLLIRERGENGRWIDELRVVDGALAYERLVIVAGDEVALRGESLAEDGELRALLAWRMCRGIGASDRAGMSAQDMKLAARREVLAAALELDPDGHEVLFQRGRLERAAGDHAAALRWFERAARAKDPLLARRWVTMAATAIAAGDRARAVEWIERAVAERPDREARLLRGFLLGSSEELRASVGAASCDRELLPWTLHDAEILPRLAECGASDAAAVARELSGWAEMYRLRKELDLWPERSKALADRLYALSLRLDALGGDTAYSLVLHRHGHEGEAALAGFEALLAEFPEQPSALFWAACELAKRKQWRRAVEYLQRHERVAGAGRSYERGVARSQLIGCLHMDACDRIYERGDYGAEPERLLDEAIALAGRDARWEGPWVAKGDLYEYRGEHATALKLYEAAVVRNPRSVHAWSGKGSCLNNLGRTAEALSCLDKALTLDRNYWHPHYAKACTLARSGGDGEEVLALVKRAITLEPTRRRQIVEDVDLAGLVIPPEWR